MVTLETFVHRVWCYFLLTLLTTNGVIHFCFALILHPLKYVAPTLFRQLLTFQLYLTVPGFLCIPFSWRGCGIYCNGMGTLKAASWKSQLLLANHSGRIDWIYGGFMGRYYGQRVGFITEAFIMFLPFIGWHRYLVEDMFVFRSFKRDRDRLIKNIEDFVASNVPRWVFLCPEGHIADFSAMDKRYIEDCETFCEEQGFDPYKMILTPRYKGMQCFTRLLPEVPDGKPRVCISATMSYVQKGERLVTPLKSNERVIPDLWSIVNGGLKCIVHIHGLELGNDPQEIKKQLMTDYELKDKLLQEFYDTGRFPDAYPGKTIEESPELWKPTPDMDLPLKTKKTTIQTKDPKNKIGDYTDNSKDDEIDYFQAVPTQHVLMNASFFGQLYIAFWTMNFFGFSDYIIPCFLSLYVLLAISHLAGERLAHGQSRESIPFEGLVKAMMFRYYGIEGGEEDEALKTNGKN